MLNCSHFTPAVMAGLKARAHSKMLLSCCVRVLLLSKFFLKGCALSSELIHLALPALDADTTMCLMYTHAPLTMVRMGSATSYLSFFPFRSAAAVATSLLRASLVLQCHWHSAARAATC